MKDQEEFLKRMENLKVPDVNPSQHQDMVKMAIMNAGRSAALGLWLVIVPCYFLLCVFMVGVRQRSAWLMSNAVKTGVPVVGVIMLLVAVLKFVQGGPWVVWAILAVLFGGLGIFNLKRSGGNQA